MSLPNKDKKWSEASDPRFDLPTLPPHGVQARKKNLHVLFAQLLTSRRPVLVTWIFGEFEVTAQGRSR